MTTPIVYILKCLNYIKSNINEYRSLSHQYATRGRELYVHRLAVTRNATLFLAIKNFNVICQTNLLEFKHFVKAIEIVLRMRPL